MDDKMEVDNMALKIERDWYKDEMILADTKRRKWKRRAKKAEARLKELEPEYASLNDKSFWELKAITQRAEAAEAKCARLIEAGDAMCSAACEAYSWEDHGHAEIYVAWHRAKDALPSQNTEER